MADRVMSASEFKAKCLALLDRVAETGDRIIVTKHGRSVAVVGPVERAKSKKSLRGSVTFLTDRDEELFSTGIKWEAQGDEE
jgi:prevent-host-death family protein